MRTCVRRPRGTVLPARRDVAGGPRRQTDERLLHYLLKNPEHSQTDGKTNNKDPFEAMAEVAARGQVEKIAEIGSQTSDHQGRKHQKSSQWYDRSRMSKRERQVLILPQALPAAFGRRMGVSERRASTGLGCDLIN